VARPRRRWRPEVSLFPFLSVLACTIGTLTLIITATATSQVAAGGVDIELYERLEQEIAEGRLQLAEIEGLEREVLGLEENLREVRERAQALAAQKASLGDRVAPDAPVEGALRKAESRIEALEGDLDPVREQGRKLRAQLDERRRQLANAPIRIRPSGSGYGLVPQFIECRKEGVVLYEAPDWKGRRVPTYLVSTSPEVTRFLQRVRFHDAGTVIFLVRAGGVAAHRAASARADRLGIRSGSMPIVGDGPFDFSAVGRS